MFTFQSKVRYSELDEEGKLSVPSIVNYFQDCSTFQSESLGVGIEYLEKSKKIWMLSHWHILFENEAKLCDEIQIGTWAYHFDKTFGYRNFMINRGEERIASASSKWVLYGVNEGRPIKITEADAKMYGEEAQLEMGTTDVRLRLAKERKEEEPFVVRRYHIDTNGHVNNGKYIQMAMEFIPEDFKIKEMVVEYKKQAALGATILPCTYKQEDWLVVALLEQATKSCYALIGFRK